MLFEFRLVKTSGSGFDLVEAGVALVEIARVWVVEMPGGLCDPSFAQDDSKDKR
jgi:hypothetical protein